MTPIVANAALPRLLVVDLTWLYVVEPTGPIRKFFPTDFLNDSFLVNSARFFAGSESCVFVVPALRCLDFTP